MIIFFSSCDRIQDSSISYDELAVSYNLKKVVLRSVLLWYREGGVNDTSILEEVRKKERLSHNEFKLVLPYEYFI